MINFCCEVIIDIAYTFLSLSSARVLFIAVICMHSFSLSERYSILLSLSLLRPLKYGIDKRLCFHSRSNSYEKKLMNNNNDRATTSMDIPIDVDSHPDDYDQQSHPRLSHSSTGSMISDGTATSGTMIASKRPKEVSPCYVCGAKAHGYNFDQSKPRELCLFNPN